MTNLLNGLKVCAKQPLDSKSYYLSLEAMANVDADIICDGQTAFCAETGKRYMYDSSLTSDKILGKWRLSGHKVYYCTATLYASAWENNTQTINVEKVTESCCVQADCENSNIQMTLLGDEEITFYASEVPEEDTTVQLVIIEGEEVKQFSQNLTLTISQSALIRLKFNNLKEINWGDGTIDAITEHRYVKAGTYIIKTNFKDVTQFNRQCLFGAYITDIDLSSLRNVTYIDEYVLCGHSMTTIDFSSLNKVKSIKNNFMTSCDKLEEITLFNCQPPVFVDENVTIFQFTPLKIIHCGEYLEAYKTAPGWKDFADKMVV